MLASVLVLLMLTGADRARPAAASSIERIVRLSVWIDRWRDVSAGPEQLSIEFIRQPEDEADSHPFVVRIYRPIGTHETLKVALIVGGAVTAGEDFLPPPAIVPIAREQRHLDVNIFQIDDDEGEGKETIEVSAFRDR